jgi:DNA-directed RNA polymerase specialized sigma24 family protein
LAGNRKQPLNLDLSKAIAGVLALLAADREERLAANGDLRKTESVLAEVGLTAAEIAQLLGKPEAGVAQAITRGRRATRPKRPKKSG